MYRYGFIGMGNMGKAILKGILKGEKAGNIIFSSEKSENMIKLWLKLYKECIMKVTILSIFVQCLFLLC